MEASAGDLLRFTTAGSVDDGKSTLIGRLLFDTKSIYQDQMDAIEDASRRRGENQTNLALLTDGLRAERDQNITIDVAYRYFATDKRTFIIADTPGHVQYTRNMVTGASTAELAIVLIDARKGAQTQSRRHGYLASLLRIPHVVVAVNKMDLVHHSERVFARIQHEYAAFATRLDFDTVTFIPISALNGDNIVHRSSSMSWYEGATLLHHLETVSVGNSANPEEFRLPVQHVLRPNQDFRGVAGRISSGGICAGSKVTVLPSGRSTTVRSVHVSGDPAPTATTGDSVTLILADDIDTGRGDMIVGVAGTAPMVDHRIEATVCWMSETPLNPTTHYILQHATRSAKAFVTRVMWRVDIDTLDREPADTLALNDIGLLELTTAEPFVFDAYRANRATGGFILINPFSNATVGAGMIIGRGGGSRRPASAVELRQQRTSPDVVWEDWNISREERETRNGHRAAVVWLTGVPASGKSTLARGLERVLFERGCQTVLLDGDQLRHGVNGDLGFDDADRRENVRRVGHIAHLCFEQGSVVICALVSPFGEARAEARALFPDDRFYEVHVDCDPAECARRDAKGLYRRAAAGEVPHFTGVSSRYEPPAEPELRIDTHRVQPDEGVAEVVALLRRAGIVDDTA